MFFKKKKSTENKNMISLENVYLVQTLIVSNLDDESGFGPRTMDMYFLARCIDGKYNELFSERELYKNEDTNMRYFNKPYITKEASLKSFLVDPDAKSMERSILFDYITEINVNSHFGVSPFDEENDETDDY